MRIVAALAALTLIASCAKPKDLVYVDISNVRIVKWGLSESQVGLEARFFNPNNQRVQLKDAEVAIYLNNVYLGNTTMDSTVQVPKKDTFAIPLLVRVQTATAISGALGSLSDTSVNFRLDGKVKMGKAGVFITYPIKYEGKQKIMDLY